MQYGLGFHQFTTGSVSFASDSCAAQATANITNTRIFSFIMPYWIVAGIIRHLVKNFSGKQNKNVKIFKLSEGPTQPRMLLRLTITAET